MLFKFHGTMFILNLPVELLDDICLNVTPTDLSAIAQTSSLLYPVAQRLLYRNLSVSSWYDNLSVVATLAKRPDLARFVRSFSVSLDPSTPIFLSFYRLLSKALSNMTDITSLGIFADASTSWLLIGTEKSAQYPHLRHFAGSFPFDSYVAKFLETTPALLELELDSTLIHSSPPPRLSMSAIPHLAQFVGSSDAAGVIVPGRPLESIHLNSGDLNEDDVTCLAQTTARVIVFGASTTSLPAPLLDVLARHLPHIVYLRIMTTHGFAKAPDVAFYEEIASGLGALPDLTAFELSGMHWGSRKKSDDGDKRVWQSKPLSVDFEHGGDEVTPPDSDIFLA